jgi:NTE family protein
LASQAAPTDDKTSAAILTTSNRDTACPPKSRIVKSDIINVLQRFPSLHRLIEPMEALLSNDGDDSLGWFGIPAGTVLFSEGDPAPDAFILLSGRLGVFIGGDTAGAPIAAVSPGEFVGEMGLISDEPRSATVIALRDSDLLRLRKDAVERLMASHSGMAMCIIELLTARLRRTSRTRQLVDATRSIAVVPLHTPLLDPKFAEHLAAALRAHLPGMREITARDSLREHEFQRTTGNDPTVLLYVADSPRSAWGRRCIRQADHVIFAADAGASISSDAAGLIAYADELHRPGDLVLINSTDARTASGGTPWLAKFSSERILHIRSSRAQDYARLARLSCGRGIGLVFSGGGARAFAHIGIVKAFASAGIPIDLIGGTSMGSLVASLVAAEMPPEMIAQTLRHAFIARNPFNDYIFPLLSLARGRKMTRLLKEHCGELLIENLWKTFFCISANLSTGNTMVHKTGLLWRALRASVGIPGIYPPWIENGEILVDGGLMLNFPTTTMSALRRGPVIGVEVAPEKIFVATATEIEEKSLLWLFLKGRKEVPSIVRILMRASLVNGEAQSAAVRAAADIVIRPDVGSISMLSFKAVDRAIEAGYRAGMDAVPQVQRLIAEASGARGADPRGSADAATFIRIPHQMVDEALVPKIA